VRALAVTLLWACASLARAQDAAAPPDDEPAAEELDATRLDVERLPPEAIQVTRALYAHGFFIEAMIGARGFVFGAGDYSDPGPWASVGVGYEILEWLHVIVSSEGSMHQTNAPAPPRATVFEILGGTASVRLQGNVSELFALWLSAQFSVLVATTDILDTYGIQGASSVGVAYGGEVGADFHFRARHHSIGLLGGVRHYPSLEGIGGTSPAIGIHGSAYLRYVF
jgi:hypothetical protein